MKGKEYLQSIGFDESHLPELFNEDDKSYYKIHELLDSFSEVVKNHGVSHHVSKCVCSNQLPRKTGKNEHTCMNCNKVIDSGC